MRLPVSMPSIPGICQSRKTISYASPASAARRTISIPSRPEGASSTSSFMLVSMFDRTARACELSSIISARWPRKSDSSGCR